MEDQTGSLPAGADTGSGEQGIQWMEVNGALLSYWVSGHGPTVVFVHGALADHRMWYRHCAAIADRYRAVALTQRYFGVAPWDGDWPPFGIDTHADDLARFIQKLGDGPVHLVAWSYAGHIALKVALTHPELLASLFLYEPGVPTYVTDAGELAAFAADAKAMFDPVFAAVDENNLHEGVRHLIDGSGHVTGYFDAQSPERQTLQLDNARTLPLQLRQSEPPVITCEQLGALVLPVCVAHGERTRPLFRIVSMAAARCIPNCRYLSVPDVGHMWPDEEPDRFTAAVIDFIERLN